MLYHCGHEGCDICGTRTCDGSYLEQYGPLYVCKPCVRLAVKFTYDAACRFGGTILDVAKPCQYAPTKK